MTATTANWLNVNVEVLDFEACPGGMGGGVINFQFGIDGHNEVLEASIRYSEIVRILNEVGVIVDLKGVFDAGGVYYAQMGSKNGPDKEMHVKDIAEVCGLEKIHSIAQHIIDHMDEYVHLVDLIHQN